MPIHADKCRPFSNSLGSVTRALNALAITGPTDGAVLSRGPSSLALFLLRWRARGGANGGGPGAARTPGKWRRVEEASGRAKPPARGGRVERRCRDGGTHARAAALGDFVRRAVRSRCTLVISDDANAIDVLVGTRIVEDEDVRLFLCVRDPSARFRVLQTAAPPVSGWSYLFN